MPPRRTAATASLPTSAGSRKTEPAPRRAAPSPAHIIAGGGAGKRRAVRPATNGSLPPPALDATLPTDCEERGPMSSRNSRPVRMRVAAAISTLVVALPCTTMPAAQAQQAVPPDIAPLLERERWLNGKCRGGSGDDPATADYCAVRDRAVEQLQAKGWCWGPPEQIEALKQWRPCKVASGPAACVASIDRYQRAVAIAFVATICQLRSDRYLALFKQARDSAYFSTPSCAQLSTTESSQVDADLARIVVDEQSKIGLREGELSRTFAHACQVLREGHTLVDLDREARPNIGK
jgi:hypothetical protein